VTLGCDAILERIAYAREPRKLPAVLSADEVVRFLEAVSGLKARIALTTAYAAGLRVSEVVGLKAADIDSDRMVIRIECGKGGKERCVMLSEQLLGILRSYWRLAHPERFLFPGRDKHRPIEPTVLHAACRSARSAAGVDKRVSVQVLRHSFRGFLLHVLPDGFHRIRHYNFLAKGNRGKSLARVRDLLHVEQPSEPNDDARDPQADQDAREPSAVCPYCGGPMRRIGQVAPTFRCDTS
jgi:integrase